MQGMGSIHQEIGSFGLRQYTGVPGWSSPHLRRNRDLHGNWNDGFGRSGQFGSGAGGSGIYNRKDEVPVDVNSTILPLDQSRKNVLIDIESGYGRAEAAVTVGDALEKTRKKVQEARPRLLPEEDPRILRRKIDFMDAKKSVLLLQIACATVFIVLLIILILPHPWSTMLSFVVGCFGAMLVVSFSTSYS